MVKYINQNTESEGKIKSYFYYDCQATDNCNSLSFFPDVYYKLIFNLSEKRIRLNDDILPKVFLIPISDKPFFFRYDSDLKILGVRIKAGILHPAIQSLLYKKSFLKIKDYQQMHKRLKTYLDAAEFERLFSAMNDFMSFFISTLFDSSQLLSDDISPHFNTVSALSKEQKKSVRQIERIYNKKTGLTPKSILNIKRYEKIENRIWENPNRSFTQLAYEFDFADQSHFIKTIRKMTEITPRELSRQLKCLKSQSTEL